MPGYTLLTPGAQTVSGVSASTPVEPYSSATFLMDVTAAATDAADTLDVYVQASVGSVWDDFVHFTQVLGNGGAKKFVAEHSALVTPESELHAPSDAALAVGVLQGPKAGRWRVKWVIVDASTVNASFNFGLWVATRR